MRKADNKMVIAVRKGLWSPEEDERLMEYMLRNGKGCWSDIARNANLQRCGKSCRLRWINYLRPDLKRGPFSPHEQYLILHLHSILGNRWSQIAARLPGRTDNEIKNFWNSTVKKRLKNNNTSNSTPSPNNSDASEPRDVMGGGGGIMCMQEHDIMTLCMDSSSSLSCMQAPVTGNYHFDTYPNLDNVSTCVEQVGVGDGVLGDYGMVEVEPYMVDLENDLFVPALGSTSRVSEENINNIFDKKTMDNHFNNSEGGIKVEEDVVGFGNNWMGESFRMGDLEWEGLLANASSLPYLDFQIE